MTNIDASRFDELFKAVDTRSDHELVQLILSQDGGADQVLDAVFQSLRGTFNPAKAGGQQATVQYDISAPDGLHTYVLRFADGTCAVERGAAEDPRVTLQIGLADFLRLRTGRLNGMQAFMSGKLKLVGDMFFAQTIQGWFDPPPA